MKAALIARYGSNDAVSVTDMDIPTLGPTAAVALEAWPSSWPVLWAQRFFTTVGKRNVELVKHLGANVAIDYRSKRFEDMAKDCDVVLDSVRGDTLVRCFECVKPGGVVASINSSTPSPAFANCAGENAGSWHRAPRCATVSGCRHLRRPNATCSERDHA